MLLRPSEFLLQLAASLAIHLELDDMLPVCFHAYWLILLAFSQEGVDSNLVPLWVRAFSTLPPLEQDAQGGASSKEVTNKFSWEKPEVPLPERLTQLLDKAAKMDFSQRRTLVEGVPQYVLLGKAPGNNTVRTIPFDRCSLFVFCLALGFINSRCYLSWYNQIQDVLRLLAACWCRFSDTQAPLELAPEVLVENAIALLRSLNEQVRLFRLERIDKRLVEATSDNNLVSKEDLQLLDRKLAIDKKLAPGKSWQFGSKFKYYKHSSPFRSGYHGFGKGKGKSKGKGKGKSKGLSYTMSSAPTSSSAS